MPWILAPDFPIYEGCTIGGESPSWWRDDRKAKKVQVLACKHYCLQHQAILVKFLFLVGFCKLRFYLKSFINYLFWLNFINYYYCSTYLRHCPNSISSECKCFLCTRSLEACRHKRDSKPLFVMLCFVGYGLCWSHKSVFYSTSKPFWTYPWCTCWISVEVQGSGL